MRVLVQRVVQSGLDGSEIGFDRIEQTIACLEVAADVTPDQAVSLAYEEANLSERDGTHIVSELGDAVEVDA